jgi:polysaccharide export outer membrane protein
MTMLSCSTPKNIKYFQDIPDSGAMKMIPKAAYVEPTIQADDIITILIQTVDLQATATVNAGNVPIQSTGSPVGTSSANQQLSAGYLVNKDGFVELPILGRIKLQGYTTTEARDIVLKEAVKYFKDPTVIIRYANFKFSVTGEVTKPGVFVSPNEKVSIIEALTLAGDLTIYGKRENILLIRENADGTKQPIRINLNKKEILSSPYFYLRQNDYLYVEPTKGKAAANDMAQTRNIAILSSILTVVIVIVSRINF